MATNSSLGTSRRRRRNGINSAILWPSRVTVKDCPCSTASMISRDLARKSRWLISALMLIPPTLAPGSTRCYNPTSLPTRLLPDLQGSASQLPDVQLPFEVFSSTASRISAPSAASSTTAPSRRSMARAVLLSRRVLKSFFGSLS